MLRREVTGIYCKRTSQTTEFEHSPSIDLLRVVCVGSSATIKRLRRGYRLSCVYVVVPMCLDRNYVVAFYYHLPDPPVSCAGQPSRGMPCHVRGIHAKYDGRNEGKGA